MADPTRSICGYGTDSADLGPNSESVIEVLESGAKGEISESKPGDPRLSRAFAAVVGGPRVLRGCPRCARDGTSSSLCDQKIKGDATELVEGYIARAGSGRSRTGREVL